MKIFLCIMLFIIVNGFSFEFLINRQSNDWLLALAGGIFLGSGYFLIYKPIKSET